jgi:hypothetical protein
MSAQQFGWTRTPKGKPDAQVFGDTLGDLNDNSDEGILIAARKRSSPINDVFEWDDTVAGHRYRILQVRTLRRSLIIVNPEAEKQDIHMPAWVQSADHEESGQYVLSIEATVAEMSDEEQRFLKHMARIEKKYAGFQFAQGVLEAIRDVRLKAATMTKSPAKKKRTASR